MRYYQKAGLGLLSAAFALSLVCGRASASPPDEQDPYENDSTDVPEVSSDAPTRDQQGATTQRDQPAAPSPCGPQRAEDQAGSFEANRGQIQSQPNYGAGLAQEDQGAQGEPGCGCADLSPNAVRWQSFYLQPLTGAVGPGWSPEINYQGAAGHQGQGQPGQRGGAGQGAQPSAPYGGGQGGACGPGIGGFGAGIGPGAEGRMTPFRLGPLPSGVGIGVH